MKKKCKSEKNLLQHDSSKLNRIEKWGKKTEQFKHNGKKKHILNFSKEEKKE